MYNIFDFYRMAQSEGEGLGTAYEYLVKQKLFNDAFTVIGTPTSIMIAGQPEKYGLSMDFQMLAHRLGVPLTVVPTAVLGVASKNGKVYDIAVSCEVIQQFAVGGRFTYLSDLYKMADKFIIFAPNGDNPDHARHSGLQAVTLSDLTVMAKMAGWNVVFSGYLDMPPFPPGLTAGNLKKPKWYYWPVKFSACVFLNAWASFEGWMSPLKPKHAHMVFCIANKKAVNVQN